MPSERNRIKYFVSDMNDIYRDIKALFFPKSIHIIDTFLVVLLFTNAKAERMNRTIGDILRNAFGYKSFDRLRKRVLYIEREKSKK